VVDEAVDEGGRGGRVREDGRPVAEGQVGREHETTALISSADDLKEQVGGAGVVGRRQLPPPRRPISQDLQDLAAGVTAGGRSKFPRFLRSANNERVRRSTRVSWQQAADPPRPLAAAVWLVARRGRRSEETRGEEMSTVMSDRVEGWTP